MALLQSSVLQEDGSHIVFDWFFDDRKSESFRKNCKDLIDKFVDAVSSKGYYVRINKSMTRDGSEIFRLNVINTELTYVFLVSDHMFEYEIQRLRVKFNV